MRVIIHYKDSSNKDAFEGVRVRKTLKGECENTDIEWFDLKCVDPDIAHFISPKDIALLRRFSKNGAKTVVSAFYAEHELGESYLKVDRYGRMSLRKNAIPMLNEANLVLVPSISIKKMCLDAGVHSEIKIAPPVVNTDRFEIDEMEKNLFLRYYGVSPERKYVLVTGNFRENRKINLLKGLARAFPKLRFYFFGSAYSYEDSLIRHYKYSSNENVKFSRIASDDIYRSAMLYASAYLVLSPLPDPVSIMEAFAAKTPVIALGDQSLNPNLIDGVTATLCESERTLIEALEKVQNGSDNGTEIAASAIANRNNLIRGGATLKSYYEKLLLEKEGNKDD